MSDDTEARAVAQRYARRAASDRYSPLRPENWQTLQERQRAMVGLFHQAGLSDLGSLLLTEVGCGSGANLLELQRLGFAPQHLSGVELLPERFAQARAELPAAVRLIEGDACAAPIPGASQDIVLASTVFSSLLDDGFQQRLAAAMWGWLKPGGAVLWYDFTVNNPRNPDVRGVPLPRVRQLFPQGTITHRRVTLAPPLARRVCAWNPALYSLLNTVPWLRTHVLAWIAKPNP
ncbi:methylase involved in ubiquinone/menaquinone biosynthesis [Burkholderiales bacterium JOSHI_001]|nr:methylase involved in ubiquinone/menaquinone biosynthesis [Burkholderiales bacterium JOSHI_001]